MHCPTNRRNFLKTSAAAMASLSLGEAPTIAIAESEAKKPVFKISLAQWSLHRTIREGKLDNLDFPALSKKEFGVDTVEYVNQFFKDKAKEQDLFGGAEAALR